MSEIVELNMGEPNRNEMPAAVGAGCDDCGEYGYFLGEIPRRVEAEFYCPDCVGRHR